MKISVVINKNIYIISSLGRKMKVNFPFPPSFVIINFYLFLPQFSFPPSLVIMERPKIKLEDRKKEVIVNKIIDWITKGSGDRLIVLKGGPASGIDIVIKKRGEYGDKAINLQVRERQSLEPGNVFKEEIQQKGFEPSNDFYLIFVYLDIVEQEISEYVWVVPSLEFRDIAELTIGGDGENILKFEAPLDESQKNKYSKFLINKRNLGKLFLEIIAEKGKFEFPEVGFREIRTINLAELKKFISEARRSTYAAEGVPVDNPRLRGSIQLEYQKGDYAYHDIYFDGEKNFIGQEVVYQDNNPIWSMAYFGTAISKEATNFLKEALLRLSEKCRFGQECDYEKREFKYEDQGQGALERFSGEEKIFLKGKEIYKLNYFGGMISK